MEKSDKLEQQPGIEPVEENQAQTKEIVTEGVTPLHDTGNGYVEFEQKLFQKDALKELRPDLFSAKSDLLNGTQSLSGFGTHFPKMAAKGNIFVRVDVSPNRVYKFDGNKWIEQNKELSQTYMFNQDYVEFLVNKIGSGEYDLDQLNEQEKIEIENYLKGNQNS